MSDNRLEWRKALEPCFTIVALLGFVLSIVDADPLASSQLLSFSWISMYLAMRQRWVIEKAMAERC